MSRKIVELGDDQREIGVSNENIRLLSKEQCAQAVTNLELYSKKMEWYVDWLKEIDEYTRKPDFCNRLFKTLSEFDLDSLYPTDAKYFLAGPQGQRLFKEDVMKILNPKHLPGRDIYHLYYLIAQNYLTAMYDMLYNDKQFRFSQIFLHSVVQRFKGEELKNRLEKAAEQVLNAKETFKTIWPKKDFHWWGKGGVDEFKRIPHAESWVEKQFVTEYKNIHFPTLFAALKLKSHLLFRLFDRMCDTFFQEEKEIE
jgi:hypothetical protein